MLYATLGVVIMGAIAYGVGALAFQEKAGQSGPNYSPERHQIMTKAFENNDYATWKTQMAGKGAANVVTQENFPRFTQMHNLMLAGKTEEANKIRQELGLGSRNGQGREKADGQRGQNRRGNFVDKDGDGVCDRI